LTYHPDAGSIFPGDMHEIKMKFNALNLEHDMYQAALNIKSNDPDNPEAIIPVMFNVLMPDPPEITVVPDSFNLNLDTGDSASYKMTIGNEGTGKLNWSVKVIQDQVDTIQQFTNYTSLYAQFKNSVTYKPGQNNGASGQQLVGPLPMNKIKSLAGTKKILAWITYADYYDEYTNTLNALSAYFSDYTLTETSETNPVYLDTLLSNTDVFLIPEQENGSSSVFSSLGSAWSNVLQNFVNNGGIVILCGSA
ncbi:MAG: hypothetical protein P8X42_08125, partial [Calditrichaceae bacterium]